MGDATLSGLIAAPFTPMRGDGAINPDIIEPMARLLARNGVSGAFVCGTTGESLSLTEAERMEIAAAWVNAAPEGFRVVVHVGHDSLEVSKRLAHQAEELGAAAIGSMGPCFFKPASVAELAAYCRELAAEAPSTPFYYYHIPSLTGLSFNMVDLLTTAGDLIPTLAGVKFTAEDLMDFELCRALDGGRYNMLFGRDEILLAALTLGANGAIGSTYNFAAPLYTRIIQAFDAGDLDTARSLQRRSMEMIRTIQGSQGSFLAASKALMAGLGVDCGPARPPLQNIERTELSGQLLPALRALGYEDFRCR
jgi:N-acetylneuraminate lyase